MLNLVQSSDGDSKGSAKNQGVHAVELRRKPQLKGWTQPHTIRIGKNQDIVGNGDVLVCYDPSDLDGKTVRVWWRGICTMCGHDSRV